MGNCFSDDAPEEHLPKLKLKVMGNSIKPHIDRAEKTGTCNLAKQGLDEVNKPQSNISSSGYESTLSTRLIDSVCVHTC